MGSRAGQLRIIKKSWEGPKGKLKTEEVNNNLLLGTNNEGRTIWHVVAEWGNLKSLPKILEMVNHLTPNGHYMFRTAQLTSRYCI